LEFGKRFRTIGYDKSERKVAALRAGSELRQATDLELTTDPAALRPARFIAVK
jgi:hypothetical protein